METSEKIPFSGKTLKLKHSILLEKETAIAYYMSFDEPQVSIRQEKLLGYFESLEQRFPHLNFKIEIVGKEIFYNSLVEDLTIKEYIITTVPKLSAESPIKDWGP